MLIPVNAALSEAAASTDAAGFCGISLPEYWQKEKGNNEYADSNDWYDD